MAKKFYLALAIGAAAAIMISGPLAADDDCEDRDRRAAKAEKSEEIVYADKDRDGKVTRKEAKVDPALERSFNQYDLDDNDILDRGEFARLEARPLREAGDNRHVGAAPMEPIEHPDARDERLRPRHVVHADPR